MVHISTPHKESILIIWFRCRLTAGAQSLHIMTFLGRDANSHLPGLSCLDISLCRIFKNLPCLQWEDHTMWSTAEVCHSPVFSQIWLILCKHSLRENLICWLLICVHCFPNEDLSRNLVGDFQTHKLRIELVSVELWASNTTMQQYEISCLQHSIFLLGGWTVWTVLLQRVTYPNRHTPHLKYLFNDLKITEAWLNGSINKSIWN